MITHDGACEADSSGSFVTARRTSCTTDHGRLDAIDLPATGQIGTRHIGEDKSGSFIRTTPNPFGALVRPGLVDLRAVVGFAGTSLDGRVDRAADRRQAARSRG